jgi:hypothetical protein
MIPFRGPLRGRFFRLEQDLHPGDHRATFQAALKISPHLRRQHFDFTQLSDPENTSLEDDEAEAWKLLSGLGFGQVRQQIRTVPSSAKRKRAEQLAGHEGTSLARLPPKRRQELLQAAELELLSRAIPRTKWMPMTFWPSGAFLEGVRTIAPRLLQLLWRGFGPLRVDPVLWGQEGAGWASLSLALLQAVQASSGPEILPSIRLEDLDMSLGHLRLRARDLTTEHTRQLLSKALEPGQPATPKLKSFSVSVQIASEPTLLAFDEEGLYRAEPPNSAGGLPRERIQRRLDDTHRACARLRSELDVLRGA